MRVKHQLQSLTYQRRSLHCLLAQQADATRTISNSRCLSMLGSDVTWQRCARRTFQLVSSSVSLSRDSLGAAPRHPADSKPVLVSAAPWDTTRAALFCWICSQLRALSQLQEAPEHLVMLNYVLLKVIWQHHKLLNVL